MSETIHLTVLNGILSDRLISSLAEYRSDKSEKSDKIGTSRERFLHELFEHGAENNLAEYVANAVIRDDNAFSRACTAGGDISPYLQRAYIKDLKEIGKLLSFESEDFEIGKPPALLRGWDDKAANLLYGYYQSSGYGKFISSFEFRYDGEQGLVPAAFAPPSPSEYKGYARERARVLDNLENLVKGLPCENFLLCGEHGMGKRALLRATAYSFMSQKLRLVSFPKEELVRLPRLMDELSRLPLFFLILIEELDDGSRIPEYCGGNILVCATARKCLDSFGLCISFLPAERESYFSALKEFVREYKIKGSNEELDALAETWAENNGYTPRSARILAGYLSSCQRKGREFRLF